jgi:hypothetical protein
MSRFFHFYQFAGPAIALPFAYWGWLRAYEGDHVLAIAALAVPIVYAYVIPGLGTNWLRLWDFNTSLKIGRFRPHHGFVFGSATSLLALPCFIPERAPFELPGLLRAAFLVGSVLAFWNWLYDAHALRSGFIVIRRQPYQAHLSHEAFAMEYAPVFFGAVGACYGSYLYVATYVLWTSRRIDLFWWVLLGGIAALLVIPLCAYVAASFVRYRASGLGFPKE